jgi:hypothetical protein
MMEIRALIIALIIGATTLTATLGYTFGLLGGNGVPVPAAANQSNKLLQVDTGLGSAYHNAVNKTTGNLATPSGNTGLIGDFFVFGGLIVATFGYIFAIPQALSTITTVVGATGAGGGAPAIFTTVLVVIAVLVTTIAGVYVIFEILSSVQKYRT